MNVHIRDVSQADSQRLERCILSLRASHDLKLSMCDALESIADGLPDQLDIQTCLTLSRCLLPTVKKAQQLEEKELFPLLLRLTANDPALLGDAVTYTITVDNVGSEDALDVGVNDVLPDGVVGDDLDWTGVVSAGEQVEFTIEATVSTDVAFYGETVVNTAT